MKLRPRFPPLSKVWNGPRFGANEPKVAGATEPAAQPDARARQASFRNADVAPPRRVELYYEETHFATLQAGAAAMPVNTYVGHRWFVHVDGAVAREWVVDAAAPPEQKQEFVLRAAEVEEPFGEFA